MKILVISDIHANLTAFQAVLANAGKIDEAWCLGDLIGYGPDPNECIDLVRQLPNLKCVEGNHDAATLRHIDMNSFNPEARLALQWTEQQLKPDNHAWMDNLPERVDADPVTLVHGSPRQPVWEYLLDTRTATLNFSFFDTPYCFVGHTHLPVLYYMAEETNFAKLIIPENSTQLALVPRTILNPGSVGQPRDRDPRAAYVILDTDQWICEFHRVPYDIEAVQQRMRQHHLPERHIQRLAIGW